MDRITSIIERNKASKNVIYTKDNKSSVIDKENNLLKIANNRKENNRNEVANKTPIQQFYVGQSIFVTGFTGFLGKMLVEKLLRSCPDISTIYVLIRSKKQTVESRLDEIFQSLAYKRLREEVPMFRSKIVPIIGNVMDDDLGISDNDKDVLIQEVSIVFNVAALVHFKAKFKTAGRVNIRGTQLILDLCRRMKKLKSIIHVSTIYTNVFLGHIDEIFYSYPIDPATFLSITNNLTEEMSDSILRKFPQWPNSYLFTKAMGESVIKDAGNDLPIGMIRPAIVISSAVEPIAGWMDTYLGPLLYIANYAKGLLRFILVQLNHPADLMPIDITTNALIVAAWDIFNHPHRKGKNALIYNHVPSNDSLLSWKEYMRITKINAQKYPFKNCLWVPTLTFFRSRILYTICFWLIHFLPALIMDTATKHLKHSTRLWPMYDKIYQFNNLTEKIIGKKRSYNNDNVQAMWNCLGKEDQHLFNFNMNNFDWPNYLENHFLGLFTILQKQEFHSLERRRRKLKRLYRIHQILKVLLIIGILYSFWKLYAKIMYHNYQSSAY